MRHQTNNIADQVESFKAIAFPKQDRVPCSTARAAQEELEEGDKDLKLSTRHSRFPEPKLIEHPWDVPKQDPTRRLHLTTIRTQRMGRIRPGASTSKSPMGPQRIGLFLVR